MFLIDSHCHLDKLTGCQHPDGLTKIINTAQASHVRMMLAIATNLDNFSVVEQLVSGKEQILLACGIHPLDLSDALYDEKQLRRVAAQANVVAIGETGLDYFYQQDQQKTQQDAFRLQIEIAKAVNKPLIIHTRHAFSDTIALLKEGNAVRGVFHCFAESDLAAAKQVLDLGFLLSFSGMITFKNALALREIVRYVPLDHILVETDSPYLAPIPYRGKENQPAHVYEVASCVAQVKGVDLNSVAITTTENFARLFQVAPLIQSLQSSTDIA